MVRSVIPVKILAVNKMFIKWRKQEQFNSFKVTVYLKECLAYKRCSASGLNCRYLNLLIKLKLIGLAIRLYQEFWKKN